MADYVDLKMNVGGKTQSVQKAWHDAERGDTINYRMKAAQTNR